MTVYCYDTEFLDTGSTIDLISIGIVCEDGREYYAVSSDFEQKLLERDEWMVKNVVAHLPLTNGVHEYTSGSGWHWSIDRESTVVKPRWVIANEVREFLLASVVPARASGIDGVDDEPAHGFPELWAYFAAYDHVVLAQLWGKMLNLPKGIPMYTHDLRQEMDRVGARSSIVPKPENAHDALADARWNLDVLRELGTVPFG